MEKLKAMQKELRRRIRERKDSYGRKMEDQLQWNISEVWRGLKTIPGHREPISQAVGSQEWMNDLNLFFNRFSPIPAPPPAWSPLGP